MNDQTDKQTLFTIRAHGTVKIEFPVPEEVVPITASGANINIAIEYYLLARYAFLHSMNSSFMINSFWAVEHLILSVLVFKYQTLPELQKEFEIHSIPKYWGKAKEIVEVKFPNWVSCMNKFDNYIADVMGYYNERYPTNSRKLKISHSGKSVQMKDGAGNRINPDSNYRLDLDKLDHFVNFMLHDIQIIPCNWSEKLTGVLSGDNLDLYKTDNNYSIIYPNKKYRGELAKL